MKLIRELTEELEYLKEAKDGKEHLYLKGIYAQAEVGNRNKRIYPLSVLENEINRYTKENIERRQAYGELGHPSGPNINLDRTCILIKEMSRDGNNFIGKGLVTSTPMGQVVRGLIEDGARLGVSTRALGSVKLNKAGLNEVQNDLRLLAIDVVADPSAPDAYVDGLMEGREWIFEASTGQWVEQVVNAHKKQVQQYSIKQIEEAKLYMFEQFLRSLSNKE